MSWKKIEPAKRTKNIKYAIRDIVVLAKEVEKKGMEMSWLNIGDPNIFDFRTPDRLIEETIKALKDNKNGYAPSNGIASAVDAIREEATNKGFKNIHEVFVTTGASEAIDIALTALLNPGDNFLLPAPTYPLYDAIINKLGASINRYYLDESNNWEPDIEDLESKINDKTKGILLINPNNPTGTNYSKESLQKVLDLAKKHGLLIFSDEIYDKILLDDSATYYSLASLDADAPIITFNGLSKSHLVPGFRIGWGIVTGANEYIKDYNSAMQKLVRARLSANHPEQYGIASSLLEPQPHINEMILKLRERRDITYNRLSNIKGLSLVKPQAAFYAFIKMDLGIDDFTFVKKVIEKTGVVIVPGSGFGQREDTNHFRVVFLPQKEILTKAFDKLEDFIENKRWLS